jgi:SAM-dependent methyltransferase
MLHNIDICKTIRDENEAYNASWIKASGLTGDHPLPVDDLGVDKLLREDMNAFMVVWLKNIDRLCSMIPTGVEIGSYQLIDVGCGSGISTLYFCAQYKFKSFLGFDISQNLINIARINKHRIISHINNVEQIEFRCIDARNIVLPDEPNVLFMFNPFGWDTLSTFLENNIKNLRKNRSFLIYANDILAAKALEYGAIVCRDDYFNLSVISF